MSEILPVAIIGTGRCGTGYTVEWLSRVGINIGHEREGRHGEANWKLSYADLKNYRSVIHVIRDPVETCKSWWRGRMTVSYQIVAQRGFDPRNRPLEHWLGWNQHCQQVADVTVRIEDWDSFAAKLFDVDRCPDVPKNINSMRALDEWTHDLKGEGCYKEAVQYARKLGYQSL